MPLVYGQDDRVCTWIAERLGYQEAAPASSAIGFERDGALVAGVMFDNMTSTNIFAHIASTAEIMPVDLLVAVARYVFVQCRARRLTFVVNDDNYRCMELVKSLGAELEGTLRWGHSAGSTLIYGLFDTSRFYRMLVATGRVVPEGESFV